jgi:hypothetical protein
MPAKLQEPLTLKGNVRLTFDQDASRWVAARSKYYLGGKSADGATELEALIALLAAEGTVHALDTGPSRTEIESVMRQCERTNTYLSLIDPRAACRDAVALFKRLIERMSVPPRPAPGAEKLVHG